ncbi:gastric triacylglycerol lipase-like [Leguminivora glycinivorella]|uniref:gastric triacylglycerol lipase-like n=1 Tax=Leguminivora glycinivorella TaxID=1035111 RepID=UPI00200CE1C8|nr:gastric triacylglycerol lipase-like [Leguminivora glycinivorella]
MPSLKFNVLLAIFLGAVKSQAPLNFTELTELNGYQSEEHKVVTEDGYVLTVYRITKGAKCKEENKKTPVFFMPPLLSAADTAMEAGPDAAVPYLISDACFDTWVGSPRGTYNGRKHVRLDPDKNKEFWSFSVDEIGKYDAPAMLEYVLKYTKKEKLMYLGFSQGGGSFFVMCSERPDICKKVKLMIGLAPATRHWYTKSVFFRILFKNIEDNLDVFDDLGIWEILGRDQVTAILSVVCRNNLKLCEWLVSVVDSPHPGSVAVSTYGRMLDRFPAGTSVQNMIRFSQSCRSKKFVKFSYGTEKNMKVYGSPDPPEYNLTAADLPILLMVGRNDAIVDVRDVKWLASKLPDVKETVIVEDPEWNHVDMFYSKFIKMTIFPKILQYILRYDEM